MNQSNEFKPLRLVSLPQDYEIDKAISSCKSSRWSYPLGIFSLAVLMEKFDFSLYWAASAMLEYITNILENPPESLKFVSIARTMPELMPPIADKLEKLNLTQSTIKARRIAETRLIGTNEQENIELKRQIQELHERIRDELTGQLFTHIPPNRAKYYENPQKGWEEIIDRFPNTLDDIEEAHKCFALDRFAAAVFHSNQIIEVGLIELGKFIGVTDPKSGWTAVTNRLDKIVNKTKHEDRTSFEQANFQFLEQLHGTVEGLKNAWRNKIGHVQGRLVLLTAQFSPEIAEEILFATRALMRRLATGLPAEITS